MSELIDNNYKGSIWERLGFDVNLCPHCKTHLYEGICLNACQLSVGAYRIMQAGLEEAQGKIRNGISNE